MTKSDGGVRRARIGGLEPQGAAGGEDDAYAAPARSRLIPRLVQFGLPIVAVAMVGGFFLIGSGGDREPSVSVAEIIELKNSGKVTNPRFVGRTKNGEPVSLRAAEARPDGLDLNRVELTDVTGEVTMKDGRVVRLRAASGLYSRDDNTVAGEGGVVISTDDGFEFTTDALDADLKENAAPSRAPVVGKGPQGEIRAGRMRLTYGSEVDVVALFDGGVEVRITRVVESRATGE